MYIFILGFSHLGAKHWSSDDVDDDDDDDDDDDGVKIIRWLVGANFVISPLGLER